MIVERSQHLQSGEDAEDAVKPAAGRLGIEVTADQYGVQSRLQALAAQKNIADRVDPDAAAGGPAPGREQIPSRPVRIGEGLAVAAAARGGADRRHRHQTGPEPLGVDMHRVHWGMHHSRGGAPMAFSVRSLSAIAAASTAGSNARYSAQYTPAATTRPTSQPTSIPPSARAAGPV